MKHKWKGQRMGGDPADAASYEWVAYCDICGVENNGENNDEVCVDLCVVCGERKPAPPPGPQSPPAWWADGWYCIKHRHLQPPCPIVG